MVAVRWGQRKLGAVSSAATRMVDFSTTGWLTGPLLCAVGNTSCRPARAIVVSRRQIEIPQGVSASERTLIASNLVAQLGGGRLFPGKISQKVQWWSFLASLLLVAALSLWRFGFPTNFDALLLHASAVFSESVLEDLQTIVLVAALLTSVVVAAKVRQTAWRWYFAVVSGVLLFVTLEELAFGQHALDLEASDFIKDVNAQNDITLHNLNWIQNSYVFLAVVSIFHSYSLFC